MCVSTAIVGMPKAVLSMTLAVFRPTPGSDSNASRVFGTPPSCFLIRILHIFKTFSALVLNKPMVRM